jgi:hypothetical protein
MKHIEDMELGLGVVTSKGLLFNSLVYSSESMIKYQWFELAAINGEWHIPVLYQKSDNSYILLLDSNGRVEMACTVEPDSALSKEILQAYFIELEAIKSQLKNRQ